MSDILQKTFGSEKRWCTWRYEELKGKKTKIPYSVSGRKASSTDPASWSTYDEVAAASDKIGIVFTPDKLLLGVDIDHCINKTTQKIEYGIPADNEDDRRATEAIKLFAKSVDTYTEISPSGTGLHFFFRLTTPLSLEANRHTPFEAYTAGRYFTVTHTPFKKERAVRTITPEEALSLLSIIGYPWKKEPEKSASPVKKNIVNKTVSLSDSDLLKKMFKSKHGKEIETLASGDISEYGKDHSAADMAFLSHLAFWTRKDTAQMERIWLSSTLGARKKAQERADYRARTIAKAIESCTTVYEPSPDKKTIATNDEHDLELLYTTTKNDGIIYIQNTENMCRILRKHSDFIGRLRYDNFKNAFEFFTDDKWCAADDNDAVTIQTQISIIFPCFSKVGKQMIFDAMVKVAHENSIDSAADYIRSFSWDGTARLDTWLSKTYGVPEDKYHISVGSNWLKGMIKRIIEPGCKFDYVLVLEGPQGSRKSTSLAILGGDWHVETTMNTDSKDFFMQFAGKAIIEFSEGETMNRTEVKKMKAIITTQIDRYRQPYGRTTQDYPRHCVFAMTTNQTEYLKDETGNRRWLPVALVFKQADTEWLKKNREQLFAEAYHRVIVDKEKTYEFPEEEMLAAQNLRRIEDANTDLISDWYYGKLSQQDRDLGITTQQVWRDALHGGFPSKPLNKAEEMNIGSVLTNMNLKKIRMMVNGIRSRRWYNGTPTFSTNVDLGEKLKEEEENW